LCGRSCAALRARLAEAGFAGSALPDSPLGLASKTVRVVPYRSEWRELFDEENARLKAVFEQAGIEARIEHTGSTAIPGVPAKPILDILIGYPDADNRRRAVDALKAAGYEYRGESGIPGRDFFRRGDPRSYHVHLCQLGGPFWVEHQRFRDYLLTHTNVAREYGDLKLRLAEEFPFDRESYINGKAEFVHHVLRMAEAEEQEK